MKFYVGKGSENNNKIIFQVLHCTHIQHIQYIHVQKYALFALRERQNKGKKKLRTKQFMKKKDCNMGHVT
jgi:hypothetical protein